MTEADDAAPDAEGRTLWHGRFAGGPAEELLAFVQERLAKFKVPRYVQLYGGFPMTPSNKISRKRLQEGEAWSSAG